MSKFKQLFACLCAGTLFLGSLGGCTNPLQEVEETNASSISVESSVNTGHHLEPENVAVDEDSEMALEVADASSSKIQNIVDSLGYPYLGGQQSSSFAGIGPLEMYPDIVATHTVQMARFPEGYTGYTAADFDGDGNEELLLSIINADGELELQLYNIEEDALVYTDSVFPAYVYEGTDLKISFKNMDTDIFTFDVFTSEVNDHPAVFYEMWETSNYIGDGVMWQLIQYEVQDGKFVEAENLIGGGSDTSVHTSFETGDLDGVLTEYLKPMAELIHSYGFTFGTFSDGVMLADQNEVTHVSRIQSESHYTWEQINDFFAENGDDAIAEAATVSVHNLLGLPAMPMEMPLPEEVESPEPVSTSTDDIITDFSKLTITGRLDTLYYSINNQNSGTAEILVLEQPLSLQCDDGSGQIYELVIETCQIGDLANSEQYYGQTITVTGEVMFAHTGHHRTPIVLLNCIIQ